MTSNTRPRPEWDRILVASQRNQPLEIRRLVSEESVPPGHSNAVGQSAIHVASLWGHIECVKVLIDVGAPVNAQNNLTGATPLHCAASSSKEPLVNRIECARLLIAAGADPALADHGYGAAGSGCGSTPLDILVDQVEHGMIEEDDNVQEFRRVLESGGAVRSQIFDLIDVADAHGIETLLAGTSSNDDTKPTACLAEHDGRTGFTPLQYAVDRLLSLDKEGTDQEREGLVLVSIVQSLLAFGSDPNAAPKRRRKRGDEMQLYDGSDLPLHRLCLFLSLAYSSSSAAQRLVATIENVASLLVKDGGAVPAQPTILLLHDACRRGNLRLVQFLIQNIGIDPNVRGRQGLTPLHFAARSGRADIVQWLLAYPDDGGEHRAVDATIVDDRGKTALDAARVNEKADVVALLEAVKH